jgi:hypothetical protein
MKFDQISSTESLQKILEEFGDAGPVHSSKHEVFERGVINVFKSLSWGYKSNSPCRFGKKIIINGLVNHSQWGFRLNWGKRRDQLADLERMLNLLDGKPVPENRNDLGVRLDRHIDAQRTSEVFEDDYFRYVLFRRDQGTSRSSGTT